MAAMLDTQVGCTTLLKKNPLLQIGLKKILEHFPFPNDATDDVDHRAWVSRPLTECHKPFDQITTNTTALAPSPQRALRAYLDMLRSFCWERPRGIVYRRRRRLVLR